MPPENDMIFSVEIKIWKQLFVSRGDDVYKRIEQKQK